MKILIVDDLEQNLYLLKTLLTNEGFEVVQALNGQLALDIVETVSVDLVISDILLPTIRKADSELMFTFNPELDTDEIWTRFIETPPDDCLLLECSYHNNPWFPDVLERERLHFLRQVESGARRQEE